MRYVFNGKNMQLNDEIKEKTMKKLGRIEKLFPENTEAHVTYSHNKNMVKVEVTAALHKRMLRAEVTGEDVKTCLDSLVDILEKQIIKYKTRLREKKRRHPITHDEEAFAPEVEAQTQDAPIAIHKKKRFAVKPMDEIEAVMEMEMLHHSFFVFRNDKTDEINVVYRRNDGEYGLIEPE